MSDLSPGKERWLDRPAITGLLGIVIGAVLGGALNAGLLEYQAWRTQRRFSAALLAHVKVSCQEAARRKLFLESLRAKPLEKRPGLVYGCFSIDLSAWDAVLPQLAQLPAEQLGRLIPFYGYARRLNLKLQIVEDNQKAYTRLADAKREEFEPIIVFEERVAAFMCAELEKYKDIQDLQELPKQWPDPPQ